MNRDNAKMMHAALASASVYRELRRTERQQMLAGEATKWPYERGLAHWYPSSDANKFQKVEKKAVSDASTKRSTYNQMVCKWMDSFTEVENDCLAAWGHTALLFRESALAIDTRNDKYDWTEARNELDEIIEESELEDLSEAIASQRDPAAVFRYILDVMNRVLTRAPLTTKEMLLWRGNVRSAPFGFV